jgi:hypothetical protein
LPRGEPVEDRAFDHVDADDRGMKMDLVLTASPLRL